MSRELKQETLAEIEEELRSGEYAPLADRIHAAWEREKSQSWHHREMEELILRHEKEVAELKKLIPKPDPDWKAICEKCHDGDIEPDCEYYGEPNGCNSPIYGEHPKAQPIGNVAAMYAALKEMQARLVAGVHDGTMDCYEALKIVEKALSKPPRNCDVGTSEEQSSRMREYCLCKDSLECRHYCMQSPKAFDCVCEWAQMPYEEGGAK